MTTTTVHRAEPEYETEEGVKTTEQFTTTIPKTLVDAMGWGKGDTIEWEVESSNKLSIEKQSE